jgi:hypothetical protein
MKLDIFTGRTIRVFVETYFCTNITNLNNLRLILQWKRGALAHRVSAGVYRQISNAYLNYYNATVLPSANNEKCSLTSRVRTVYLNVARWFQGVRSRDLVCGVKRPNDN